MLVLARRKSERIILRTPDGTVIVVTAVEIRGQAGKVKIGIDAPPEVMVDREEIYTKKLAKGGV